MATDSSLTSKRFRSEDSSIDISPSSPNELFSCLFCTFSSSSADELDFHAHTQHQHICSQCLHIFPSYFLLDLHMDEKHNNYLSMQSYRCLIESCPKIFSDFKQRFEHLTTEHSTKDYALNEIYRFFSNEKICENKSQETEKKFGCDSQKTFIRNSRLKPRHLLDAHWDGDE